ncbi:hypothetical protein FA13DRAFT_65094 [Coprinellus micaceus]|uniref:Uncharacterized protein n=1 Tax=Coprinellus micaceus TaxID=71717 RepID=A0A4Y7TJF4_COPMI|nr:hypothetical protein FA13DRAFT_65094 [Coprinellus micaceus]
MGWRRSPHPKSYQARDPGIGRVCASVISSLPWIVPIAVECRSLILNQEGRALSMSRAFTPIPVSPPTRPPVLGVCGILVILRMYVWSELDSFYCAFTHLIIG